MTEQEKQFLQKITACLGAKKDIAEWKEIMFLDWLLKNEVVKLAKPQKRKKHF